VAYVVAPQRLAPATAGGEVDPATVPGLLSVLDGQLDLQRIDTDPGVVVYRNLAFHPGSAPAGPGSRPAPRWPAYAGAAGWLLALVALALTRRTGRIERAAAPVTVPVAVPARLGHPRPQVVPPTPIPARVEADDDGVRVP
jgi:hypothetical protein